MGQPVEQVFKTLVVQLGKGDHALVMVPAGRALDLKKFARAIGEKKATMTTQRGAEAATGLRKGGIGALALAHKRWGVYLDESAQQFDAILVNGGERGVNLKVPVADLVRVLNARVVDVTTRTCGAGTAQATRMATGLFAAPGALPGYDTTSYQPARAALAGADRTIRPGFDHQATY